MTDNRTTELREKLTEHGVDYEVKDLSNIKFFHDTRWNANGVHWCYTEFVGATTCLTMCNEWKDCTPEQAIAATLGKQTWRNSYDWQAIADEVSAELESGTCEWLYPQGPSGWLGFAECSKCGYRVYEGTIDEREWTCCPHCGAKAVER